MPIPTTATELPDSPYLVESAARSDIQSANVLQAKPRPIFHMVHHPDNWEIGTVMVDGVAKAYWLPEMAEILVVPGVNQCRTIKANEPKEAAYAGQLAWFAHKGMIAVPMDAIIGETDSYIAKTACQHPRTRVSGVHHFDVWSSPKPTKAGKAVKYWRDRHAFNAWRLELVLRGWRRPDGTTGRLPDVDPDVIAAKLANLDFHLNRKVAETALPERAYALEVAAREELIKQHSGAEVVHFEGASTVPVVDYSSALIAALSQRVASGEEPEAVLAEFPGLESRIVDAVTAAKPEPPKVTTPKVTTPKKRGK